MKAEKGAIAEKNKEIQKKLHKKEQLTAQISESELEIRKLDHEVKQLSDEYQKSVIREKEYSKKCKNDKTLEEAAALSDIEARELEKRIRNGQEKRNKLSRTVNAKAQSMYDVEEKQVKQLECFFVVSLLYLTNFSTTKYYNECTLLKKIR